MNFQSVKDNETRAIVYCRSEVRDDLQLQTEKILSYAKMQGYTVTETFMESGSMDSFTYHKDVETIAKKISKMLEDYNITDIDEFLSSMKKKSEAEM